MSTTTHHTKPHGTSRKGYRPTGKSKAEQASKSRSAWVQYEADDSVKTFVIKVRSAQVSQLVEIERKGVRPRLLKDLANELDISSTRFFSIVGIPKATAEKKVARDELVAGAGGQATLNVARLLGIAMKMMGESTAVEAKGFDTSKWLGRWIEQPQRSLGGRRPADLLDTPTGFQAVAKILGAIQSGAYQ